MSPPSRAALASLHPIPADVLLVLALDAEMPWARTTWCERARDAGIRDERGRQITGDALKAIADDLRKREIVALSPRGELYLKRGWVVPIIESGKRRGRLAEIANGLRMNARGRFGFGGGLSPRGALLAALAHGDRDGVKVAASILRTMTMRYGAVTDVFAPVLGYEPPAAWLSLLEPQERAAYLKEIVPRAFGQAIRLGDDVRAISLAEGDSEIRATVAMVLALAGESSAALAALESKADNAQWIRGARAFVALTQARHDEARTLFAEAAVGSRKQRVELPGVLAPFDVLLAVTSDSSEEVADVDRRMTKGRRNFAEYFSASRALEAVEVYRRSGAKRPPGDVRSASRNWIDALFGALADRWMGDEPVERELLEMIANDVRADGYEWLAQTLEQVIRNERAGSLLALFGEKEGWQLTLESLKSAIERATPSADKPAVRARNDAELWWTVDVDRHHGARWMDVEVFAVGKRANKGKRVSVDRILEEASGTRPSSGYVIDDHDRRAAQAVAQAKARDYMIRRSVLRSLVDHPRVRDVLGNHVRVEVADPKLVVESTPAGMRLRLEPSAFDESDTFVQRDGDRFVVYSRNAVVARVLSVLPAEGVVVPNEGRALLAELLGIAGSAIAVDASAAIGDEALKADSRIRVQLFRAGTGLRARFRVVPATSAGPALRPGVPPAETVLTIDGALTRVVRDLDLERANLNALLERCPILASLPREGDDIVARDLETCFELLVELRSAELDTVIEWIEGAPLRVSTARGTSSLQLWVGGNTKWLEIDGQLAVDDQRVLSMRELLDCASRARGRFVPIGEDQFVALTEDLLKRLGALGGLDALATKGQIPAALLPAIDAIGDGVTVSFGEDVEKMRAALEAARCLEVRTPRDLAAELRDYQREGFRFLARRAEAGLGACLADDMGLGKTVQALALLLHRRKRGPALVIAPTSVCRNWENETTRFAPSLNVRRFGEGDRRACIDAARSGDIVVASYGLLSAEEELLASRAWGTIVFDEAHALKNATTKRWSAARALRSDATVALTGTPVENHARELHALFDLLTPGMLGSRAAFERVLGGPIADGNRDAATLLRNLVRPFVLRRTKSEVLSELPPKTEVLHVVPPSAEHLAFYEAVRRRAIEKTNAAKAARGQHAGHARIDLLAEIMRLRRAAIDPRLVGGEEAPAGAKIDALVDLVTELRAEGRRALVFSQFLEVLDLSRAALEATGVDCLRLDGTMSASARSEQVDAFQGGRGDVFLVSLKAGGIGMNLTGADVVILLDPWWNPAVEDQAAGRVHRIGQTRPVTIARIVTESTIEEKVLALHEKKRRLYEDVVSEADGAGTLDVDAIVALLSEPSDGGRSLEASAVTQERP